MIQINDDWRIEIDPMNVCLQKKTVIEKSKDESRNGKEVWRDVGYYPTIKAAIRGFVKHDIAVPDSYWALVTRLDAIYALIGSLEV